MAVKQKLDDKQKEELVRRLAMWESKTELADFALSAWGIELTPAAISYYDPTTKAGGKTSERWVHIFEEQRRHFTSDLDAEPLSHIRFRLRALHKIYLGHMERKEWGSARSTLQQAAMEVGGKFTNIVGIAEGIGGVISIADPDVEDWVRASSDYHRELGDKVLEATARFLSPENPAEA